MNCDLPTLAFVVGFLSTTAVLAQTSANWKAISAGNAFTFLAPPDTAPYSDGGKAIDSFVGMYRNAKFTLMFDYGRWSNDLSGLSSRPGYTTEQARIDGQDAIIVSGRGGNFNGCTDYMSAVYIVVSPSFGSGGTTRLMMSGCTRDVGALPDIQAVFRSLRFSTD
ncbi:MAG TPA: hypothetical protein VGM17_15315 [Rhizomicrobium sp.]|jgi:hypothetical protein